MKIRIKNLLIYKKEIIGKFNELISKNKVVQKATNITDNKKWIINVF